MLERCKTTTVDFDHLHSLLMCARERRGEPERGHNSISWISRETVYSSCNCCPMTIFANSERWLHQLHRRPAAHRTSATIPSLSNGQKQDPHRRSRCLMVQGWCPRVQRRVISWVRFWTSGPCAVDEYERDIAGSVYAALSLRSLTWNLHRKMGDEEEPEGDMQYRVSRMCTCRAYS